MMQALADTNTDTGRAWQAVLRGLFEGDVGIGVADPRRAQPALMPEEQAAVAHAVPRRRREFAAGRAAARAAMRQMGGGALPVRAAADRAPIWPAGWQGSISHTSEICLACASTAAAALGLDVEQDKALDEDILATICTISEISQITGADRGHLAKLIFSAKEAAYKAQYPLTGVLFGFDTLEIILDPDRYRFTAIFLKPAGCFAVGDSLPGRFARTQGHLVTAVTIGQGSVKGA